MIDRYGEKKRECSEPVAFLLMARTMSNLKRQRSSLMEADLKPILIMEDSGGRTESPLIRTNDERDDDPVPIFPSPGFVPGESQQLPSKETNAKQRGRNSSIPNNSVKETESDGNSMGVLYQSTIGSINGEPKDAHRNGN